MSNKFKAIQHIERIKSAEFKVSPKLNKRKNETCYVQTQYERNGKVLQKLELKKQKPSDNFSKFKVSDFALENLIAIGVPLEPTHLSQDVHSGISYVEGQLDKLSSSIEQSELNKFTNPQITE